MYRVGGMGHPVKTLKLGTVDDLSLHETKLKPTREIWAKDRVAWLEPLEGMGQYERGRSAASGQANQEMSIKKKGET